ncbi:uncharacterized protein H6S33_005616 [Morchella sextelata]|uniref:uncharacterized protein n=1 Tax=Morchella sextelata TaxID=1174677 RepID=UPI001D047233|nr:uncharacterized protein H6S33_005616 [Morchella sextelata]KAH0613730.1 hypothetical protein H6S33_005616 [Morchella sextelata]
MVRLPLRTNCERMQSSPWSGIGSILTVSVLPCLFEIQELCFWRIHPVGTPGPPIPALKLKAHDGLYRLSQSRMQPLATADMVSGYPANTASNLWTLSKDYGAQNRSAYLQPSIVSLLATLKKRTSGLAILKEPLKGIRTHPPTR